jgi:hypothetical protein
MQRSTATDVANLTRASPHGLPAVIWNATTSERRPDCWNMAFIEFSVSKALGKPLINTSSFAGLS